MNKVIIKGRLTRDAEASQTQGGKTYCKFTLAVDRFGKERKTDFIPCVSWDKTAETIGRYCSKGKEILVEGRIVTGSYEAKDGTKRKTMDVMVDRIEFCGSKAESQEGQGALPFVAVDNDPIPF